MSQNLNLHLNEQTRGISMGKVIKISAIVFLSAGLAVVQANSIKLYDVKSGKITYKIKGSGNMMGAKMQVIGKKRVIFDSNGAKYRRGKNRKAEFYGQEKS